MARRRKKEEKASGAPMWMVTFSDLVTLLLTFFVLLVSMATFDDVQRVDAVLESIRRSFGVGGIDHRLIAIAKEQSFTEKDQEDQALQPAVAKLREAFAEHVSDHYVLISETETELRIRLDGRVFFRVGSAELHPAAYAVLGDVAELLSQECVDIRVEGYADGLGSEAKNWQLSADRAVAVVLALRERGPVDGEPLEAAGFGSFRPGVEIGKDAAWDRRVELVLRTNDMAAASAASRLTDGGADARP